jgi:erythronate-4-phosphate dehydrogenase
MNKPYKLIIDDAVPFAKEMFSHLGEVVCVPGEEIGLSHARNADALIIRSRTQVNSGLLKGSSVSFVGSTVVGLDHVEQTYLADNNIEFYSAQGCNANSVAEYVIACILNFAEEHNWDLSQKSIGIIGVGHVGKLLLNKALALGLTILPNDPPREKREAKSGQLNFVSLEKALAADIVSFHTPLTTEGEFATFQLLNKDNFSLITPNTLLINAARGGIIDEAIWAKTPTAGNIIDCWQNEPNINKALYQKATIATPHIAGHALEAKIKGSYLVYKQLCCFLKQKEQQEWQKHIPKQPTPIKLTELNTSQKTLQKLIAECYQPIKDHLAIASTDIKSIHKKFEYHRRHYPLHREWSEHEVIIPPNHSIEKTLKRLGFKVFQDKKPS